MILCYQDLLDHVLAYAGDDATATATAKHRRAVQDAMRVVGNRHQWIYLWSLGRITTHGAYSTGTIEYDHTGGANERQVTLTGGTWPTWAADGYLVFNNTPYQVAARISDTVLTLGVNQNPGEDVAAATEFELLQDQYQLPTDFLAGDETVVNDIGTVLTYEHPRTWSSQRRTSAGPGQPVTFTYVGDQNRIGTLKMALFPAPDSAYAIDFLYRRRPRQCFFEMVTDGTVGATGTAVTGAGTAFTARMIGSVIRLAGDNQTMPTGEGGGNPAVEERVVTAVASATALTVDSAFTDTHAGVRYVVTDPVDVEPLVMGEYLLREIEAQWRIVARSKVDKLDEQRDYNMALQRALEGDSRSTSRGAALRSQSRRSGFLHYPVEFFPG